MNKYIKFDLKAISRNLGEHYSQVSEDEHTGWCDCGTEVTQYQKRCEGCGMGVVWINSKAWKNKYGSPTTWMRELLSIMPDDRAGIHLMGLANLPGFKDREEYDRWNRIISVLNQPDVIGIVNRCSRKTSGRGLVKYTLNAAEKVIENKPVKGTGEIRDWV